MASSDLKQRAMEYVQEADEPLLQLMETLAEKFNAKVLSESDLPEEQWNVIDQRREAYLRGEGASYSWEEVKDRARKSAKWSQADKKKIYHTESNKNTLKTMSIPE